MRYFNTEEHFQGIGSSLSLSLRYGAAVSIMKTIVEVVV